MRTALFEKQNSGQLLGGDTASLGPQDRFQRQKRLDEEVTVIDGNSIPESGLLRYQTNFRNAQTLHVQA